MRWRVVKQGGWYYPERKVWWEGSRRHTWGRVYADASKYSDGLNGRVLLIECYPTRSLAIAHCRAEMAAASEPEVVWESEVENG